MRFGALCGVDHLVFRGIGAAVQNVVAHRSVQQGRVLRHHPDMAAQTVLRDARDVLPVDQNAARFDIVEPQEQFDQGGFPRARAADEPDFLTRFERQVQCL